MGSADMHMLIWGWRCLMYFSKAAVKTPEMIAALDAHEHILEGTPDVSDVLDNLTV